ALGPTCVSGCDAGAPMQCGGMCVDPSSDPNHCGACGNACATAVGHAQPACDAGGCSFACNAGYGACDGGCVDETTDNAHCGGWGGAGAGGKTCPGGAWGWPGRG